MTIETLKSFRKELHKFPELSGYESETAGRLKKFLENHHRVDIIENVGGTGLAVVRDFSEDGPTIVVRCELDALPIEEENNFEYRSINKGVSHKCGHDGHMAIVAGLVSRLEESNFQNGKVILLFQPAEETGTGAPDVLNDPRFSGLKPDFVFALHNIPGYPLNGIVIVENNFSSTVESVAIRLEGQESHSAQPEHGRNPALCMAELFSRFDKLNRNDSSKEDFRLFVPIYSQMGKKSYGISAGFGEMHFTLRTRGQAEMERLKKDVNHILTEVCPKHGMPFSTEWFDYFPAVVNHPTCYRAIVRAAKEKGFEIIYKNEPFKFGEDFGHYSERIPAAMFGIGAGEDSPALHQADYDFPDEIIETGMDMFIGIIEVVLQIQKL